MIGNMYQKINQNFIKALNDNWLQFKGSTSVSHFASGDASIEYFNLANIQEFRNCHLRKFFTIPPTTVLYTEVKGDVDGLLWPHKDHNTLCVLNYYIHAGNDETVFYSLKNNEVQPFRYKDKEVSNIYCPDDLVEVDKFVAHSNDAYLLDVSQIHAVKKLTDQPRIFISYQWKENIYNEILDDIMESYA